MIPYGKQYIDNEDIEEVKKVLNSDYLTTGPKVNEFEEKVAKYVGAKYAVAVSNGTAALHIACMAAGLKKGEELITSPMTFAASSNCALYCGANPVFADITEQGLIDPEKIEEKITNKTKIIIPVDYSGLPCNMQIIQEIADKHDLIVIEDSCHALGAKYQGNHVGDCRYSDMNIFSFHPVKHITTGEGGMITTNSKEIYEKLKILRTHGITKDKKFLKNDEGPWYYEMQYLGYNYRLTDLQCALGISQLRKLDKFISRRREIAKIYSEKFYDETFFNILVENKNQYSSYHLFPILLKNKAKRKEIFEELRKNNLWVQVHYIPVYLQPYYQKLGHIKGLCPISEEFYRREISIPMYPAMTDDDINTVIDTIFSAFQ
jgi:UDP-4-amino-4,6-dideoxy-N-acetyl-beta-L-altrosamine transaminase